jgi:Rad3-related DNA helicase
LEPLRYSSGKTQIDLIEEVLEALRENDIVFLRGTVGSGKSVVGLRTILEFERGIVSVPTKVLSDQYAASYERDKYFMKNDGQKARIGILKGRGNFRCMFQEDKRREISCDNSTLPCKRPVDWEAGERRIDALRECPHWGFIFSSGLAESIKDAEKVPYQGIKGKWVWCMRGECPYWKQFQAYVFSDAIVVNSAKWAAEVSIGRLPEARITVIDEADGWLDSLAVKVLLTGKTIEGVRERIRRNIMLDYEGGETELQDRLEELRDLWSETLAGRGDPLKLVEFLTGLLEEIDETSGRLYWKLKSVLEHRGHAEWEIGGRGIVYFVPDPKIVLQSLLDRVGGKWLLMSATVQSEDVLRDVFGIAPTFVEGETRFPGELVQRRLGSEEVINYRKWMDDGFRQKYWSTLHEIMREAKRQGFVPVHAHKYLPPGLRKKVLESADVCYHRDIMLSTKMDRGADLKEMKSVIILKFPYPDRGDPLLKGMERRLGAEAFRRYYRDMAEREFVQQIGRTLRSDDDVVEFWSPDNMCHAHLGRLWKGSVVEA